MKASLTKRLQSLCDSRYADFQRKLIPSVPAQCIMGIRTPILRQLAKDLVAEDGGQALLKEVPHKFFEENQLHAFILSCMKDFDLCLTEVERFLPYIDNWATCDQLTPHCFSRHRQSILPAIKRWLSSPHEYTVRFGIRMLMQHFLDNDFKPEYLELVATVQYEDYYVRMMQAWYFATALAKQYESTLPYLQSRRLERWTHNKTIQKAIESFRISDEHKEILRTLRWKQED